MADGTTSSLTSRRWWSNRNFYFCYSTLEILTLLVASTKLSDSTFLKESWSGIRARALKRLQQLMTETRSWSKKRFECFTCLEAVKVGHHLPEFGAFLQRAFELGNFLLLKVKIGEAISFIIEKFLNEHLKTEPYLRGFLNASVE